MASLSIIKILEHLDDPNRKEITLSVQRSFVPPITIRINIHSQYVITDNPCSRLKHYDYSLFYFLSSLSGCMP